MEKENQREVCKKKLLELTSLGVVHAPEPARIERPCNTQGIEKRPQNWVPLVMGPNSPNTKGCPGLP